MTRDEYIDYLEEDYYRRKALEGEELMMYQRIISAEREGKELTQEEALKLTTPEVTSIDVLDSDPTSEVVDRPLIMNNFDPQKREVSVMNSGIMDDVDKEIEDLVAKVQEEKSKKKNQRPLRVKDE